MDQLFNDKPYKKCTYTLHTNRSYTDCLESRQYGARKETTILHRNNRIPTKEVVWHLRRVLSVAEIKALRTQVFDYLRKHEIVAVVSIELTRGDNGLPNNTVHFHFLLDDPRSENELREVFNTACECSGLVRGKDFRIDYRRLSNGDRYFEYFTKYDRYYKGGDGDEEVDNESLKRKGWNWKTVLLFRKSTGLHKFYQIGKWFHKSKKQIWDDYKQEMQEMYGTDPDKNYTVSCKPEQNAYDDSNNNDYNNTEQSCNDEVPTGYNVWTMWCQYPDDTWEEVCARFEQYKAYKDKTQDSQPSIMPKWCSPKTGRISHRRLVRKHHIIRTSALTPNAVMHSEIYNNFILMKSEMMTNETIPSITICSNTTEKTMQDPMDKSFSPFPSTTPEVESNHGTTPAVGGIPKEVAGGYNTSGMDDEKSHHIELEGNQDVPKKKIKKSNKIAKQATSPPIQADKATFVELSEILPSDTFRCREREDSKTVNEYAVIFKDFKKAVKDKEKPKYPFPPVWIWQDEKNKYHLVAGFHRYRAAEKAKIPKILAKVFTGTKADALLFAIKDNRTHGLKMKYGDLKFAISKALKLSKGMTAGAIAAELGYTRSYVYRIEKELSTCGQLTNQDTKLGADGKVRKTSRKAKPKAIPESTATAPHDVFPPNDDSPFVFDDKPMVAHNNSDATYPDYTPSKGTIHKIKYSRVADQVTFVQSIIDGMVRKFPPKEHAGIYESMVKWASEKLNGLSQQQE